MNHDKYVSEQLEYYRARAGEYDEWFSRQGRYDRGKAHTRQWQREIAEVEGVLSGLAPLGRVLELACGTGWWTRRLVSHAKHVTALDAAPEVLALNAERIRTVSDTHAPVDYVQADIFEWRSAETFDVIFFSFWLSHVPPERFAAFWRGLEPLLAPGGRVFLLDSLAQPQATARNQALPEADSAVTRRKLNDGREFDIIKIFYTPETLRERLEPLGWRVRAAQTERFFVDGEATRA